MTSQGTRCSGLFSVLIFVRSSAIFDIADLPVLGVVLAGSPVILLFVSSLLLTHMFIKKGHFSPL